MSRTSEDAKDRWMVGLWGSLSFVTVKGRYHAYCKSNTFSVQSCGWIGEFRSESEGTQALRAHFQSCHPDQATPPISGSGVGLPRRTQAQDVESFKELYATFKHCLPGDLESCITLDQDPAFRAMIDDDPVFELISVQGKIQPFKEALLSAWKELPTPHQTTRTPWERGQRAVFTLQRAIRSLSANKFPEWSCSTGRHNQYHSGWLKAAIDWKIIKPHTKAARTSTTSGCQKPIGRTAKAKTASKAHKAHGRDSATAEPSRTSTKHSPHRSPKNILADDEDMLERDAFEEAFPQKCFQPRQEAEVKAKPPAVAPHKSIGTTMSTTSATSRRAFCKLLTLGEGSKVYELITDAANIELMGGVAAAADIMKSALDPPPHTLEEWASKVDEVTAGLSRLCGDLGVSKIPRLNHKGGYSLIWTFRSMALIRMKSGRCGAPWMLALQGGESLNLLQRCFPDQSNWLRRLVPKQNRTLKGLLMQLDFEGEPLEFLTMWQCLLLDSELRALNVEWISANKSKLQSVAAHFRTVHKFWPHPVICVGALDATVLLTLDALQRRAESFLGVRKRLTGKQPASEAWIPARATPPSFNPKAGKEVSYFDFDSFLGLSPATKNHMNNTNTKPVSNRWQLW